MIEPTRKTTRTYRYKTCCVNCSQKDVPFLNDMIDNGREVSLRTFRRHCDSQEWEREMGYSREFPISSDWHVAYFRSRYRGKPCYYAVHSAIEYIFSA